MCGNIKRVNSSYLDYKSKSNWVGWKPGGQNGSPHLISYKQLFCGSLSSQNPAARLLRQRRKTNGFVTSAILRFKTRLIVGFRNKKETKYTGQNRAHRYTNSRLLFQWIYLCASRIKSLSFFLVYFIFVSLLTFFIFYKTRVNNKFLSVSKKVLTN